MLRIKLRLSASLTRPNPYVTLLEGLRLLIVTNHEPPTVPNTTLLTR